MTTEKTEQIPAAETSTKEETKTEKTNDKFLQQEPTAENEIHVAAKGHIKNYLGYAFRILNKTNHQQLKIRATGNAIVKANILIELVKRRVGDLHQLNSIYSMVISSHEEKLGENIETKRRVTAMDTLLSKSPLDTNDPGYQEPTPKDEPYQSQSRPSGQSRMNKKDDKRRRGPKLYNNPPMGGEDDDGKTDKKRGPDNKDRQQADQNKDKRSKQRSRRDKINAPAVKDDEGSRRTDNRNMDRSRGGYMPQTDHYGRPMMGDGRNNQYNTPMDQRGFDSRRNQSRHMPPYMMYPGPRSFDDFGVRPMRGQKGNRRGFQDNYNNRRPMNDMYMYGPPSYDQNYHYGGYDNYYGPPPDRRYPPRNHGHGPNDNPRYNEPRGPRQPYNNSERFNNDNQNPNYRGDRSERPVGQGPQMNDKPGRMMGPTNPDSTEKQYEGRRYNEHRENRDGPKEGRDNRDNREERPRYNQPRDDEPRHGYQMRGGGSSYGGSGYRGRGGPRGGMGMGGPHRGGFDNDNEGGRSRFNGGFDNRNDGGSMRGIRGNLRGGRGHFERGRGGMERSHYNDDNSGPMHKISERRAEDGMENRRGMAPYRGRGRDDEQRGGRSHFNDDERRSERGGFNPSERGEEGRGNIGPPTHKIISKSRGGLGSSGND